MFFYLLDTLINQPARFGQLLPVLLATFALSLLVAITVHEFGHALVANLLGDRTARDLGRVSLNPLRHLDPTGTVLLVLVGIGWGKPVPVNPAMLANARRGMALVAFAGPAMNFVTAALLAIPVHSGAVGFYSPIWPLPGSLSDPGMGAAMVSFAIFFNITLGLFNLLPLPPLDGFRVAQGLAPRDLAMTMGRLEQYGMVLLLMLFAVDWFSKAGIVWRAMRPIADALGTAFTGHGFL